MEQDIADFRDITNNKRGRKVVRLIALCIGGIFLAALFALVLGIVVQLLWNWLMPDIFGLKRLSYWQAFGLLFLGRLLFGGFGHHGSFHSKKHPCTDRNDQWKLYGRFWREKGESATDELLGHTKIEKCRNKKDDKEG